MKRVAPWLLAALLVGAATLPAWTMERYPYLLQLAVNVLIFTVLALSWDILARTGQLSLAHAAFYGLGAYVSTLLTIRAHAPVALAMLGAAAAAVLTAIGLGVLTLRLRGIYFAIATLAFAESLRVAAKQLAFTGRSTGLVVPPLGVGLPGQYWIILGILVLCVLVSWRLHRSRWHFAFTAIRTNEEVAAVMGVDVVRFKVAAFAISALFAGVTGAFYAHVFLFISPVEVFSIGVSVGALVAPIFGGLYTTAGPVLGAVVLRAGEEVLREVFGRGFLIIYGAILAMVILFMPRGLLSVWESVRGRRVRPTVRPSA